MIISFSGLDGVGKTTQITYLMEYMKSKGLKCCSVYDISPDIRYHNKKDLLCYYDYFQTFDVIHTRFRMNSDANNKIINELEHSPVIPNHSLAMQAAHQGYYDAKEWFDTVTFPLLSNSQKIFIYDRYSWDEIAFKTFYGCSLEYMEKLYVHIKKPRISFICTANASTIMKRNSGRPDEKITLYTSLDYINQLRNIFSKLAIAHNLCQMNMESSAENIHKKIINYIDPLFKY